MDRGAGGGQSLPIFIAVRAYTIYIDSPPRPHGLTFELGERGVLDRRYVLDFMHARES